jgi:catechol 2,3-dioxygenase-like lactoylglutathione lyase family enzyme
MRFIPIFRVQDIDAALRFYCGTLGFVLESENRIPDGGPAYCAVSYRGAPLHLSSFSGDGTFGAATLLWVDDVDALYERFQAAGVTSFPVVPTNQTWGQRELYVRDADGNTLRFASPLRE